MHCLDADNLFLQCLVISTLEGSQVCVWELRAFIQETAWLRLQHKKSFSCIQQHGWPALSAGFPHYLENPLTCCTRVRDGWDWVSQCFLQSFLPPCAIKFDSHTVQCANCGPFAEERSAGYIVLYSWRKFWWYVFFFGLFFTVGSSSSSVSWSCFHFSAIFVFPPEIPPTGNVVTRAVLGQKNYPPLKKKKS